MEQDDLASMVRYLLYAADLDTQGIIYSASRYHWAGDGNGTSFYLPGREYNTSQTSWRWTGTRYIQDIVLAAYAEVFPNLVKHDNFPSPQDLLRLVKVGNIDFEGEFNHDTDGSNLIRSLLLDHDPRPLYLQAWGGTNTIARALLSIEETYNNTRFWSHVQDTISRKAVIMASGFQDETYANYITKRWPAIRVESYGSTASTWGYNCNFTGQGSTVGLPDKHVYFTGAWIEANILQGPYGKLSRTWLDGQMMPGDQLDGFGNLTTALAVDPWCPPIREQYAYLGEGDDICFLPLLPTGLQDPANPSVGGWGGRAVRNTSEPNLWNSVAEEKSRNGTEVLNYSSDRWIPAVQNDFAARIQWTLTPDYSAANHPPSVRIVNGSTVRVAAGTTVDLTAEVSDPDGDKVELTWFQYFEEGTYPGHLKITSNEVHATVAIPTNATADQTASIIVQGTDDGHFPLSRYDRVILQVC
ncbi:hypothetical protein LTR56_019616 [Elasticomyces elasticus]|nr:hypothetical protein LTR56_019616 [Elasticomyces elasticus]KAK3634450.1 hypothetical protein LTR22_019609 [Elasticomyces elasticus]KAK4917056.1 hypothetical protein LTR49_014959 [Elasticomyces elasticus]KAK5750726.1 hypothetical protein LTS12_019171 [Elasticomyces elasticus]